MQLRDYENVFFCNDNQSQLRGIIAIHDTTMGPALGGCRAILYEDEEQALVDVLRLSRGMTYKAALAKIPHGGGKSIMMMPKNLENREALLISFAKHIDRLNGNYITAEDSGTSQADMDLMSKYTKFITGKSGQGGSGDPSPMTALGVLRGIQAVAKFLWNRNDLEGLTIAVQGVGHVGYPLAKHLHENGAKLIVCDVVKEYTQRAADELNAKVVDPDYIYDQECDIFSPNALGGVVNNYTVGRLRCKVVAGASNNQLDETKHGEELAQREILYAPDYAINAGGLINVSQEWAGYNAEIAIEKTKNIYDTMMEIFEKSKSSGQRPEQVADAIVEERIAAKKAEK